MNLVETAVVALEKVVNVYCDDKSRKGMDEVRDYYATYEKVLSSEGEGLPEETILELEGRAKTAYKTFWENKTPCW